jgi:hypothetical protein
MSSTPLKPPLEDTSKLNDTVKTAREKKIVSTVSHEHAVNEMESNCNFVALGISECKHCEDGEANR